MQVHGTILSIGHTQQVSDKFSKREFVLTIDQDKPYTQTVQFELHQTSTDIIDAYREGQEVSVDFNLKGRQWNGPEGTKTFNTLVAWKIQPVNK